MHMRLWIAACVLVGATSSARAEHHHHADHHDDAGGSAFGAGVSLVAATFDNLMYVGNYQGIAANGRWTRGRFGAIASAAVYRLEENGARFYGLGDLHVHGMAMLVGNERANAGVMLGVSAPIGDDRRGMGMGHVMVMPHAFGVWNIERVALSATAGYSRALGAGSEHDPGPWPLVEPMLVSEISWSAGGDVSVARAVRVGGRASGGISTGVGDSRVVGALRVGWRSGRVDSAVELQAGLAGDPFTVRGVVSTALMF